MLQSVAMGCNGLQRVAVCCSVLQCVAVGCSGLQWVAVGGFRYCKNFRVCVGFFVQRGKDLQDALSCRSFFAKVP